MPLPSAAPGGPLVQLRPEKARERARAAVERLLEGPPRGAGGGYAACGCACAGAAGNNGAGAEWDRAAGCVAGVDRVSFATLRSVLAAVRAPSRPRCFAPLTSASIWLGGVALR